MPTTHEVTNQPPPLGEYDLFATDRGLAAGLVREGGGWAEARVRSFGATVGGEPFVWGQQANAYPPVLRTHDRFGHRIDEVEYHPAWHALMRRAIEHELHALPWRAARPGAHVARAALFYLQSQAEAGHGCPISMTYAVLPALRVQPDVAVEWEPRFTSTTYDPRPLPAGQKAGALCGMAMTEKQGGSDVRTNTTRARPLGRGGPGAEYELTGHKWFCSAPMCDAFLMLAQTERGLSCFLVPRWRPDGTRNTIHLQRLKDKLGNRSNASADIELESEAATATMLRLARAYDDAGERHFARLATAVAKYWVCKRAPAFVAEALECLGGNGYVEESGMPRLYREAPLNGIWEGSGNVICLDVLRALAHGPEPLEAFYAELGLAAGADRRLDAHVARLKEELADRTHLEARARSLVERMALALEAALLVRHAEPAIADAFCASRLGDAQGRAFGTLPPGLDGARILPSAWPAAE